MSQEIDPNAQMNMDEFERAQTEAASNSGGEWANIPKLVTEHGKMIRLVGSFKKAWEHFVNLPAGARPYLCGGPESDCPICAAVARLATSENPVHQKLAKEVKAKERFYFNVLDRTPAGRVAHANSKTCMLLAQNAKGNSIGTQLFRAFGGVVAMRQQMGQNKDPNTFDMMLTKEGSGVNTKYGAQYNGMAEPLTAEELQYKRWPLEEIARLAKPADLQAAAEMILTGSVRVSDDGEQPQTNPSKPTASGPLQRARTIAPPPAQPPRTQQSQQRIAMPAPQMPPPAQQQPAPARLQIKPQQTEQYQSTAPRQINESDDVTTNCTECGADMIISMSDTRDLKCHACGKIYEHPSKS